MKPRIKVAACDLRLFLAKKNGAFLNEAEASAVFLDEHGDLNGFDPMMASLYLKNSNHFGADFKPDEGQIHVLVSPVVMVPTRELPSTYLVSADQGHPGSGPDGGAWMFEKGWTEKWLAKFCKSQLSQQQLPVVGDRAEFISNELPDKITRHQETYDQWVNKMTFPSLELMAKLFRIENSEQCVDFVSMINVRILHPTTPDNDSFVSFWDDIIRSTLNFVLPSGKTSRYSRRSRPIGSRRPDYLFTADSVCVFRGEEEDPGEEMETPELKLITKLFWSYGGAPYVFGYAAVGYDVKLYAITHASDANHAIELGSYNLRHLEGRFRLLLALLNAAQLLPSVVKMCPESARDEYKTLDRDLGIKV